MSEKLQAVFDREVEANGIIICQGCELSHRRAYAELKTRIVHILPGVPTRKRLFTGLHEIGHIVTNTPKMKRWEMEKTATDWAKEKMREYGVPIPKGVIGKYNAYIERWKRFGARVAAGRKK